MNNNILKKALEELSKDSPKLDYVRGMLETLIEITEAKPGAIVTTANSMSGFAAGNTSPNYHSVPNTATEESMLDAMAISNLEKIRNIAARSVEQA